jgi:O-antigen/teichoic acid export membrane protein
MEKKTSKLKLFTENILVYGVGGIISKIIPLIMVPIVTRLMPDSSYYGISDLSNTLVSLASSLAVMGMYDAMYRLFFEKDEEEYKRDVCSTAFIFTLITSLVVFVIMILIREPLSQWFFGDRQYSYLIYISAIATLVGATNSIISAPTRMQNQRKIFLITNTVSPILSYAISIPLLLQGHYVIALPIAGAVASLTMEITFEVLNHKWFSFKRFDTKILKELLVIALPLLPNFLIYWVFNSSDRIMITNLLSVGESGIYSVGSKLGNASQLIYTAFAGGWQYFAFSTMKENDQVKSNSLIFEYLGVISFAAASLICAWSYPIYKLLFEDEYVRSFIVAPYLFLAPLLQMLYQVACNQFLVVKKTWPNMLILSVGAVANVFLNFLLIPRIGIEGASIATLIGYVISDIICSIVLCRMKLMVVSGRFLIDCGLMLTFFVVWRMLLTTRWVIATVAALSFIGILILLYKKEFREVIRRVKNIRKHE